MAPPIFPATSWAEAFERLDDLNRAEQTRKTTDLQHLQSLVAASWTPSPESGDTDDLSAGASRARPAPPGRRPASVAPEEPQPYVALPQRKTHGGPWGPKVAAILTEKALAKRGGW